MLKFRPHHVMCTFAFQGYGYSQSFVENYQEIVSKLPECKIEVVKGLDQICSACPKIQHNRCVKQDTVLELDKKHMQILEIEIGQVLTWNEAVEKIRRKMSLSKFEYACQGCSCKPHGMCKNALLKLIEEKEVV
ncbi:hypothetical protein BIY23_02500 [Wolbachia pipientis]|uniref:DUF1284 domain-containing protein n=1 Tax=Wolbachia pipientis TaxID=955 RepID=A0A1E7QK21_WOLPI|nr:DUF1284 domain-containing protein [Wolbachia pipientis]OEY86706.1 hypothetical protein BIY23_02500 [Wolbachia pipientis]